MPRKSTIGHLRDIGEDARFKLTVEQEIELDNDINDGILTRKEIQDKYGLSKSRVWQLFNKKKNKQNEKIRIAKQKKLYDKEKQLEAQRKYRAKLKELGKS